MQATGEMVEGSCHCGAVRWRFAGVPESATACNCSVCRRYGALLAYDFEGWLARFQDRDGRQPMGFNLRLATPEAVGAIALIHHDTETMDDLPREGRCVADVWF